MTVGLEDEVMVLDPRTFDFAPQGARLVALLGDPRIRTELPAAQVELVTGPGATVSAAARELAELRRLAARGARALGLRLAAAAVHPFAPPSGPLNDAPHYSDLAAKYGTVAMRQLVFGLHVHVAVRGEDRVVPVYNALREHLPLITALSANAPFYGGRDTGLASVRPEISTLLPRQGVPPAFASWEHVADTFRFGRAAGSVADAGSWWWEARLHPRWGTVEVRVADAQSTVSEAAGIAAFIQCLIAWLADRHDARDLPAPAETWRIAENRWSAYRHGLDGTMAEARTGARRPTREALAMLLDRLGSVATGLGCAAELRTARDLVACNGSERLRAVIAERGLPEAVAWLADRFEAPHGDSRAQRVGG
jgi:carboxylate-amine ligase